LRAFDAVWARRSSTVGPAEAGRAGFPDGDIRQVHWIEAGLSGI